MIKLTKKVELTNPKLHLKLVFFLRVFGLFGFRELEAIWSFMKFKLDRLELLDIPKGQPSSQQNNFKAMFNIKITKKKLGPVKWSWKDHICGRFD